MSCRSCLMVMSYLCTKMINTICQLDNTGQWYSMDVVKVIGSILKNVKVYIKLEYDERV